MSLEAPFSIYEDEVEGIVNELDDSLSLNTCDIPFASVEDDIASLCSQQTTTRRDPNRRSSAYTCSSISSLPSDIMAVPEAGAEHARYTPMKGARPPFRNPSSVRAMQMSSPPPFTATPSPVFHRTRNSIHELQRSESRQSHRSTRSRSHLHNSRPATPQTPLQAPKNAYPLVLLHVTLLPFSLPYPAHLVKAVLPPWLVDNFRLLEAKLADHVLMGRGVLIPHPKDEYDLLEERLLESLELATPRLLKCGHFYEEKNEQHDEFEQDDDEYASSQGTLRRRSMASQMTEDQENYEMICEECDQPVGLPEMGVGSGKRRWEVKMYAANGLMRAGAWQAAWTEMERVDVEVTPWIPDHLKRELERRWDEELKAETDSNKDVTPAQPPLKMEDLEQSSKAMRNHGYPSPPLSVSSPVPIEVNTEHEIHELRPLLEGRTTMQSPMPPEPVAEPSRGPSRVGSRSSSRKQHGDEVIPLGTLLKNCIYLWVQDRRNIALVVLSVLVAVLCLRPTNTPGLVVDKGFPMERGDTVGNALEQIHDSPVAASILPETLQETKSTEPKPVVSISTLVVTETVVQTAATPSASIPEATSDAAQPLQSVEPDLPEEKADEIVKAEEKIQMVEPDDEMQIAAVTEPLNTTNDSAQESVA